MYLYSEAVEYRTFAFRALLLRTPPRESKNRYAFFAGKYNQSPNPLVAVKLMISVWQ
jgi:hypothetical protein